MKNLRTSNCSLDIKTNIKLTLKQDKAAQVFIENGGNKSAAYRDAYDTSNMADNTIYRKAHELFSNGKVTARIDELTSEHRIRHDITVDSITHELDENRRLAALSGNVNAMNAATIAKAKLHGLFGIKPFKEATKKSQTSTHWVVSVMK